MKIDELSDEKELAEHNMLVDLGRNDLGKISRFGSVSVEKYHCIERFSHVMHIGSTVRGEIADNRTAIDAVDAVLPAGTLSGAPKIRACQLINDLENNKRGIYGGAIGYLDFTGNLVYLYCNSDCVQEKREKFLSEAEPELFTTQSRRTSIRSVSIKRQRLLRRLKPRRKKIFKKFSKINICM